MKIIESRRKNELSADLLHVAAVLVLWALREINTEQVLIVAIAVLCY